MPLTVGDLLELPGLGLLNVKTVLTPKKTLVEMTGTDRATGGWLHAGQGAAIDGEPSRTAAGREQETVVTQPTVTTHSPYRSLR